MLNIWDAMWEGLTPYTLHNSLLCFRGLNSIWTELVGSSAYGQTPILLWVEPEFKFYLYHIPAVPMCMGFVHDKHKVILYLTGKKGVTFEKL